MKPLNEKKLRKLIRKTLQEQPNHACYDFSLDETAQACCEKCASAGWTGGATNLSPTDPCFELTADPAFGLAACKCCATMPLRWACTDTATDYIAWGSSETSETGDWQDNPMGDGWEIGGVCVSSYNPNFPYASEEECETAGCGDDDDGGIPFNDDPVNPEGMPVGPEKPGKAPLSKRQKARRKDLEDPFINERVSLKNRSKDLGYLK